MHIWKSLNINMEGDNKKNWGGGVGGGGLRVSDFGVPGRDSAAATAAAQIT